MAGFGAVIAGAGVYMTRGLMMTVAEAKLNQISAVISKSLEVELERALSDAEDMATNPLVMNALVDSSDRDAYLRPYIGNLRRNDASTIRISVHDFSGSELAANRPDTGDDHLNAHVKELVLRGLQLVIGPDFQGHAQLMIPVVHPATEMAEGFVVWDIDLASMLHRASRLIDDDASVSLIGSDGRSVAHYGAEVGDDDLQHSYPIVLGPGLSGLALTLSVRHSRQLISLPMNQLTIFSVTGTIIALILALVIARAMGRRVAAPIVQLSRVAANVDPDRLGVALELPPGNDEVAALGQSFAEMMQRLKQSHDTLEQRVRERTAELEAAQRDARDQAARIHSVVDNIADGIITFDESGTIESVNAAAERIFGYAAGQMVGRSLKLLMPDGFNLADSGGPNFPFAEMIGLGDLDQPRELEGRRSDGMLFLLELSVSKITDHGRTLHTGVVRDINDRRNAERRLWESQAHLERAQQLAGLGSWEWTPEDDSLVISDAMLDIIGIDERDAPRTRAGLVGVVHPEDRREVCARLDAVLHGGELYESEHRILRPDGSVRIIEERGELSGDALAETRLLVTARDITAAKEARDDLRLAASVFEATVEAIAITDCDGVVLAANTAFEELTGHSRENVQGTRLSELWSIDPEGEEFLEFRRQVMETGRWQGEFSDQREDGSRFVSWQSVSLVRDSTGEPARLIVVFSDITDLRDKDLHIRHQAFHDSLTDLPNRALLRDRLNQTIVKAQRTERQAALMFLDLDRFKVINDSLGHNAGDQLLIVVSERLKSSLRQKDTIARFGGDEFVVLVDDFESPELLGNIARKIIEAVARPIFVEGRELHVSTSIGIAVFPSDGDNVETLMRNADVAMYRAKAEGRNCFKFYHSEMNSRSVERLNLETALRRAVEQDQFELFYQPKIDLRRGQPFGLEALIRWRHPINGLVSPMDFIPVAEETGMILPIGEWVIRETCRQIREWQDSGIPVVPVAINLSVRQFRDTAIIDRIHQALSAADLQPGMLGLEITESTAMSREGETMEVMTELRRRGHALMVDDFGTGYSSLSYLRQLPISGLKVDQSFVDGIGVSPEDEAIVEAVLGIAEALDLEVVAEGVETAEQAEFLIAKGCHIGQGYLYAKPLPRDECARWLSDNSAGADSGRRLLTAAR